MMEHIPSSSIVFLVIAAILLLAVPVVYTILWGRKAKIVPAVLIAGVLGFLISARVFEMIPHIFCIVLDNPVSRFINGNVIAYMIYGAMMAGIFEECGRYVIFRFILKKHKNPETSITYGIGHGGFEVLSISFLAVVNSLTIAIMINTLGFENALTAMGVTDATRETAMASITPLFSYGISSAFVAVFERIVCMIIHITLSVVVFYGVHTKKISYLFMAIAAHAVLDAPAALVQKNVCPIWVCEVWLVICAIVFTLWAKKLYGQLKESAANQ